jgi:hypothetical protein
MPYKHTELKIPKEHDRRIKLTDEQRNEIKKLYGKISQRKLAVMFNVSRRLIIFIGNPEAEKRNKECYYERGGSKVYYDKNKHTKAMKKHRQHKQELYLKNKLIGDDEDENFNKI